MARFPTGTSEEDDVEKQRDEAAREATKDALLQMRTQVRLVERLKEKCAEEDGCSVHGMRLSATPRGGGIYTGLDARMIMREEAYRILQQEEARMVRLERKARKLMEGMAPGLYAFCVVYYIGGLGLADAAQVLDRSDRQCRRYKMEIEG